MALLVFQRPNLLLLDEPTNHLDLEMRHALSVALQGFEGAMVIVSHDRHLLRTTTDQLLLVSGGQVDEFSGALDDYPAWLIENRNAAEEKVEAGSGENSATARRERKQLEAENRRLLQPLRKKLKALEKELDRLSQQQQMLEQQLAEPEIYVSEQKDQLKRMLTEKVEIDQMLMRTEESWLGASEAVDAAEQNL